MHDRHLRGPGVRRAARAVSLGAFLATFGCGEPQDIVSPADVDGPQFASTSSLPHINNTSLPLPAVITADLSAYDCSNSPGPQITFEGLTVLGGFGLNLIFRNNQKGTHEHVADNFVTVTVQSPGQQIVIPKQPVLGGAGGNPFIWVQFLHADGSPASDEIFVGRCVQGAGWHVTGPTSAMASAWAEFTVEGCENSPGPYIDFHSGLTLAGLKARIIFRNNDNKVGGPHKAQATQDVTLIASGTSYTFPKQPVQGGVGGNPWIWAAFTDGGGTVLSSPELLGKCVQLDKAVNG